MPRLFNGKNRDKQKYFNCVSNAIRGINNHISGTVDIFMKENYNKWQLL
jgi:hypothetical protein